MKVSRIRSYPSRSCSRFLHGFFFVVLCTSTTTQSLGATHNTKAELPYSIHTHELQLTTELDSFSSDVQDPVSESTWLIDSGLSHNAQTLIRAIQDAKVHGLNPERYGIDQILLTVDLLTRLDRHRYRDPDAGPRPLSATAIAQRSELSDRLDESFVQLVLDHATGLADTSLKQNTNREKPTLNGNALLAALHKGDTTVSEALESAIPQSDEYQRLSRHLRNLLTEHSSSVARRSITHRDISQTPHRNRLANKLITVGELPITTDLNTVSDKQIQDAIKAFQTRHAVASTGTIDDATQQWLNQSLLEEITATVINLERWRWLPRDLGNQHVWVNIPQYTAGFVSDNETRLRMRTVVGSPKHPTPRFSQNMTHLVVNPTWTVPAVISNRTLIPRERKQPGYLVENGFTFLKRHNGKLVEVPTDEVESTDFLASSFPYILRQSSGQGNALGQLKFMLPNPYAIYLHDTPSRHQFSHHTRAYSSGCVRLEKPNMLARTLLEASQFSETFINNKLSSQGTVRINLPNSFPVHISYFTAWTDEKTHQLHQAADIYHYDESLAAELIQANSLLSTFSTQHLALNTHVN